MVCACSHQRLAAFFPALPVPNPKPKTLDVEEVAKEEERRPV